MAQLILGMIFGIGVGFALGRRQSTQASTPPVATSVAAPLRPSATVVVAPAAPATPTSTLATGPRAPNPKAAKVGLTERDFQPSDDILERMQQAWDLGVSLDELDDVLAARPNPDLPPVPTADRLSDDDRLSRVAARLAGAPPGEADPTPGKETTMPDEPAPLAAPSAGTVTEALAQLDTEGYGDDLRLDGGHVSCNTCGAVHPTESIEVDRVLRFEGPSDPADEAIVLGLRCPECGAKGSMVSAFGPDADPDLAEAFVYLASRARHG